MVCRHFHLPQAGEGLYSIALSYTLTVDDLLSVNTGLTTTSTLRIGQGRLLLWACRADG